MENYVGERIVLRGYYRPLRSPRIRPADRKKDYAQARIVCPTSSRAPDVY